MRIGIFGGAFNPPHKGHAASLCAFVKSAKLDKVLVIPSYISPHKSAPEKSASFEERCEMCALAFPKNIDGCEVTVSDIERDLFLQNGEKSYTFKTVEALLNKDDICLFVGSDMFLTLDTWKNPEYILKTCEIYTLARDKGEDEKLLDFSNKLQKRFKTRKVQIINTPPTPASSTDARAGAMTLLDTRVKDFIHEKGIYNE